MKDQSENTANFANDVDKLEELSTENASLSSMKPAPYALNQNANSSVSSPNLPIQQATTNATATPPAYGNVESQENEDKEENAQEQQYATDGDNPVLPNGEDDETGESNPDDSDEKVKETAEKDKEKSAQESVDKIGEKGQEEKEADKKEGEENNEAKKKEQGEKDQKGKEDVSKAAGDKQEKAKKNRKKSSQKGKKETAAGMEGASKKTAETTNQTANAGGPVAPAAPTGNLGGGGGNTYVLSKAKAEGFAGDIVKESPGGNVVIAPATPLANAAELGAQPVPAGIEEAENEKRQAANSASIQTFAAGNNSTIEGIRQKGTALVSNLNIAISQGTSRVKIAEQQALGQLNSEIAAAISTATAAFDTAITTVNGQFDTTLAAIEASSAKALGDLDGVGSEMDTLAATTEEELKTTALGHMDAAIEHLNTEAQTKGAEAVSLAQAQAAIEGAKPVKEQSRWEKIKNGGDYYKNKRAARVKACNEVGTRLQKEFATQAADAVSQMEGGKAESGTLVATKTAEMKTSIAEQIAQKKVEVETSKQQSIQSATTLKETQLESLNSAKEEQLASLEELGQTKTTEIQSGAAQQIAQIQSIGQSSKASLQSTLQGGLQALEQTNQSSISTLKAQERIKVADFQKIVGDVGASFSAQSQEFMATLESSSAEINSSITSAASDGESAISELMSSTSQAISQTSGQITQLVTSLTTSAQTQFDQIKTGSETADSTLVTSTKNTLTSQMEGFKTQMTTALGSMGTDVMTSAKEVTAGFQSEVSAIQTTMMASAQKAEDAVQPRWKSFLKILIDVVFAIALAVIVAALATVLGPFALILAAIAIGAALGVGKQMLNNAIDGKPLMEGTLKAAVIGGIEGLFAAVGAGALSKAMSKGGGMLTGKAATAFTKVAGPLKNFAGKAIGKFTTKLATNVAEKVTTQIATNVMDGKSWKTDLWKATSGAIIDTVMGEAGGKITSKIGGSDALGDAVGDSLTKRATRTAAEIGVDFTMDTIGDGAKKVVENADQILGADSFSEGLSQAGSSFVEGATTDMDDRLLKNALNKAKDPIVNSVKDNIGNSAAQEQGLQQAPEGYAYNQVYDDDGNIKMDLRATHAQNSDGKPLADLTTDGNGGFQRRQTVPFPEADQIKTKEEFMQMYDPDGKLPSHITGEAYNHLRQGNKDKFDEAMQPYQPRNNNDEDPDADVAKTTPAPVPDDPELSASANRAQRAGLPRAPKGYHYSTSASGTLYIRRTSAVDKNGNPRAQMRIEGDKLVPVNDFRTSAPVGGLPDAEAQGYKPGIDPAYIASLPVGYKPPVDQYLNPNVIQAHADEFGAQGAGFIVVKSWTEGGNPKYRSMPPRKFVGLRSEMDAIIADYNASGGDWTILRDRLNLGPDTDLSTEEIHYVKIDGSDSRFSYDMPTGNEGGTIPGAWVPGGKTKDGTAEAALVGSENVIHNKDIDQLLSFFPDNEKIK